MQTLQRNQLLWLTDAGWLQVRTRTWDMQAQDVLRHWHREQLPVVVCTQRNRDAAHTISVGLPAPTCWGRRKLAVEIPLSAVQRTGSFPSVRQMTQYAFAAPLVRVLQDYLMPYADAALVYGSYGWQALTGLEYIRPSSDLDLHLPVADHAAAAQAARLLETLQLPARLDGELVFPSGMAVAWREYLQWARGAVAQVLVKSRRCAELMDGGALHAMQARRAA